MPPSEGAARALTRHGHWIGGVQVPSSSGAHFEDLDPETDRPFALAARGTAEDVAAAAQAAQAAFPAFSLAPLNLRESILSRAAAILERDAEDIPPLMITEIGSPIGKARHEVQRAADVFRAAAGITPFNVPVGKGVRLSAIPLAFGNTVVMLPSEDSPLMALRLARGYEEAGLPPGCFNVVTGYGHEIGDALTGHPLVRSISFTGSTRVGTHIRELAARSGKKLTLELGGNSPLVVLDDADLPRAVQAADGSGIAASPPC